MSGLGPPQGMPSQPQTSPWAQPGMQFGGMQGIPQNWLSMFQGMGMPGLGAGPSPLAANQGAPVGAPPQPSPLSANQGAPVGAAPAVANQGAQGGVPTSNPTSFANALLPLSGPTPPAPMGGSLGSLQLQNTQTNPLLRMLGGVA